MRPLYIFDLDGTIANIEHRLWLLHTGSKTRHRDFEAQCLNDRPNGPVIVVMHALLKAGADVWVFSGRSELVRDKTEHWLEEYTMLPRPYDARLVMRPVGDHRPDDELKQKYLDHMLHYDRERLVGVFDDRQRVVDMWRKNGITCFQVGPGDF